jgi:two-component system phosphate regulon response regulator PhoB
MKKILIVDDQREIRELVAATLRIGPYQIFQAANGPEALDLVQRERPDLILLDVMMQVGGMDGFEACRRIKTDLETSGSFVMMLTARDQKTDLEQGYAAGANDYFTKPFSPLELMAKVDEVMNS